MYDLRNGATLARQQLRPIGRPWSFFIIMRILGCGQILENNRVHEMFNIFGTKKSRIRAYSEDLTIIIGSIKFQQNDLNTLILRCVYKGETQTNKFRPLSGILRQIKYVPLRYMPLKIELSSVDHATDHLAPMNGAIFTARTHLHYGPCRTLK